MVVFRHDADPAVYIAIIGFNLASCTTPAENTVLLLARLGSWIAFVIDVLFEKYPQGCRRNYSSIFKTFLRLATTVLVGSGSQFTEYWRPKEFKADTKSHSLDFRRKFVLDMFHNATRISFLATLSRIFLAIDAFCLNTFVSKELKESHDCYDAEFADDAKSIHRLGSSDPWSLLTSAVVQHLTE